MLFITSNTSPNHLLHQQEPGYSYNGKRAAHHGTWADGRLFACDGLAVSSKFHIYSNWWLEPAGRDLLSFAIFWHDPRMKPGKNQQLLTDDGRLIISNCVVIGRKNV